MAHWSHLSSTSGWSYPPPAEHCWHAASNSSRGASEGSAPSKRVSKPEPTWTMFRRYGHWKRDLPRRYGRVQGENDQHSNWQTETAGFGGTLVLDKSKHCLTLPQPLLAASPAAWLIHFDQYYICPIPRSQQTTTIKTNGQWWCTQIHLKMYHLLNSLYVMVSNSTHQCQTISEGYTLW